MVSLSTTPFSTSSLALVTTISTLSLSMETIRVTHASSSTNITFRQPSFNTVTRMARTKPSPTTGYILVGSAANTIATKPSTRLRTGVSLPSPVLPTTCVSTAFSGSVDTVVVVTLNMGRTLTHPSRQTRSTVACSNTSLLS